MNEHSGDENREGEQYDRTGDDREGENYDRLGDEASEERTADARDEESYDRTDEDEPIAKIYYADEEATQVDAAFVIEDWDWVVGFNQIATDEYDYVSIPVEKVIGVMSPQYASFSQNGRRVTGYGVTDDELGAFADLLPV